MDNKLIASIVPKFDSEALESISSTVFESVSKSTSQAIDTIISQRTEQLSRDLASTQTLTPTSEGMAEVIKADSEEAKKDDIETKTAKAIQTASNMDLSNLVSKIGKTLSTALSLSTYIQPVVRAISSLKESHKANTEGVTKEVTESKMGIGALSKSLGAVIASAVVIATAVVAIFKLFDLFMDKLQSAFPGLRNVMDLIDKAINMVWLPMAVIMTEKIVPIVSRLFTKIADWMSRAWDIYDKEGWAGLIRESLIMSFEVLGELFAGFLPLIGDIFGGIYDALPTWAKSFIDFATMWTDTLRHIWSRFASVFEGDKSIGQIAVELATTIVTSITSLALDFISGVLNLPKMIIQLLNDTIPGLLRSLGLNDFADGVEDFFDSCISIIEDVQGYLGDFNKWLDELPSKVSTFISDAVRYMEENEPFKSILSAINGIGDILGTYVKGFLEFIDKMGGALGKIASGDILGGIGDMGGVVVEASKSIANAIADLIPGMPHMASGGIVTQPQLAVVGEAGPEAIIPLDKAQGFGRQEIVNNFYISGISDEQLVAKIRREVSSSASLAKTRVGF